MKKILLIAGAAMIAASAVAGTPKHEIALSKTPATEKISRVRPTKSVRLNGDYKVNADKLYRLTAQGKKLGIQAAAEEATDPEAPSMNVRYVNPVYGTLYAGKSPDGWPFPFVYQLEDESLDAYTVGLAGNKGSLRFYNFSEGADAYEWAYDYMGPSDDAMVPVTSEKEQLTVGIEGAFTQFLPPTLTGFKGTDQVVFENPFVDAFLAAPNLASFGIYPSRYFQYFEEGEADYFGVSPCPVNDYADGGSTPALEYAIDRNPIDDYKDFYQENGTFFIFETVLRQAYPALDIKNIAMSQLLAEIPAQNQPYLLTQTWASFYYKAKEDFTLTFTVCPVVDDRIMLQSPIGTGEVILPKHDDISFEMAVCDLYGFDEGFPTSDPVVADGAVAIFISGFDSDKIEFFAPMFNGGTSYNPVGTEDSSTYFVSHASVMLSCDVKGENGEREDDMFVWPCNFFDQYGSDYDEDGNPLPPYWVPSDFSIYYDVIFPFVETLDGSNDLSVDVPTAGGEVAYKYDSTFSISELIAEGKMTVECDADWFTYTTSTVTETTSSGVEYDLNQIDITAQALPEGEKGRYGVIKFRGFAHDFDVIVKQGEVAGISNVPAVGGSVELYDLQGRKLNAVPANGIYLERQGNKTTKRIAR